MACSRWAEGEPWPTICIKDADRAIKLNNWLTRRMLRRAGAHVAENQTEKDALKVLTEKIVKLQKSIPNVAIASN